MFEKIDYQNNKELFDKYIKLKGIYLHKQIYDILLDKNDDVVKYNELSSIIRYDKCLRDLLYKYLATFEEELRSRIFLDWDVENKDIIYDYKNYNVLKESIYKRSGDCENSNLYYCFKLDLGRTIQLVEEKMMFDKDTISEYRNIKELRNLVMHHNLVIAGNATSWNNALNNKRIITNYIKSLLNSLPSEYRRGFISDMNKLICDVKELKINLE